MSQSQNQLIKAHLESGKPLTGMEALHRYGCFRLPARIADIKAQGVPVESKLVKVGPKKWVSEYRIGVPSA